MTWARYDDALPFNRKVAWLRSHGERGIAALGLHLLANTWSRHEGMQGFIPAYVPEQLVGRPHAKLAALLVEIGMFERVAEGWMINDYEEYGDRDDGTSAVERKARISRVRAEAGRRGGVAKAANRASSASSNPDSKPASKPLALPEQTSTPVPVPVPKSGNSPTAEVLSVARTERGTRLPDNWTPTRDDREWARQRGYDTRWCVEHTERFRNYWLAKTGRDATKLDWSRTWRKWIADQADRTNQQPRGSTTDQRVADGLALAARLEATPPAKELLA